MSSWMLIDVLATKRAVSRDFAGQRLVRRGVGEPVATASPNGFGDFTRRFPVGNQTERFGAELQRVCVAEGVVIGSIQIQQHFPSEDRLARSEVSLSLAGTYPKIMQAVGEALARTPNATLRHMSLRRVTANAEVAASVVIEVWGQPSWPGTNLLNESR